MTSGGDQAARKVPPDGVIDRRPAWARYSGAIERIDLGEADHDRGVVMVDITPDGKLAPAPVSIELNACPFYRVEVDGSAGLDGLARRYADREPTRAYVELTLRYDASPASATLTGAAI
jgi:hypothetical protein